ncbi:MAG: hypothetical protein ACREJM_11530, partial [Candidatus Saccharimonadales bacterium]
WELIHLDDPVTGDPVTGVVYTVPAVHFSYAPAALAAKVLATGDWFEIGGGAYLMRFAATELTQVGKLAFSVINTLWAPVYDATDVDPAPLSFLASPATCIITGNIVDLAGRALSDQNQSLTISFRISSVPQQVGNQSIISTRLITTTTDVFGNFSVALLRNAQVVMEADPLGLKQQFTVPDQDSATILSVLPPF